MGIDIEKLGITPRPWRLAKRNEEGYILYGATGTPVCKAPLYPGTNNWYPNYKLILIAPEMLKTLIYFKKTFESSDYDLQTLLHMVDDCFEEFGKSYSEIKKVIS